LGNNTWDSPFVFLLISGLQTRKSCRYRVSRASHFLIFSYVNLSPYLITFGDGLRLHHASALHDRIRSEENFYNLLCRLFRRTFASQIYDNPHNKKPLTESTSVKGESTFRGATLLHDNMRALSGY